MNEKAEFGSKRTDNIDQRLRVFEMKPDREI